VVNVTLQAEAGGQSAGEPAPARSQRTAGRGTPRRTLPFIVAVLCGFIAVLNHVVDLKDREAYQNFYAALSSCEGAACLLMTDDVRSPIFLSLLILGQRAGLDFNLLFTLISVASLWLFAVAMRVLRDDHGDLRFVLISLALGSWLYLIQVKLFLALALYMYGRTRRQQWLRIMLAVAAVLTHESMLFFIALYWLWQPRKWRISFGSLTLFMLLAALLIVYLSTASNVFVSAFERIQHYNEIAAGGEVPSMSRLSPFSAFLLMLGAIGLLRLRLPGAATISTQQLKASAWLFLPWVVFMIFASNAVFALRLAELALLHVLLVLPLGHDYRLPSRLLLLVFATAFGALTFVRDVLFG
jgi:hypothetical protein